MRIKSWNKIYGNVSRDMPYHIKMRPAVILFLNQNDTNKLIWMSAKQIYVKNFMLGMIAPLRKRYKVCIISDEFASLFSPTKKARRCNHVILS